MATYYIGSMAFSDGSDILHYGVKGMKWGIRRYEYDGVRNLRRRRAIRIASRLREVNSDTVRIQRMTRRQKESLRRATKYWTDRAEGKKPSIKRNIIARRMDAWSSRTYIERIKAAKYMDLLFSNGTSSNRNTVLKEKFPLINKPVSSLDREMYRIRRYRIFGHF